MEVNTSAPVLAVSEIVVAADRETVWEVLTDIEHWPRWNPAVTEASLHGRLQEGSTFRWKAGPGTITSTIRRVTRPHVMTWTGKTLGLDAIHVYRLETRDGKTVVSTAESWDGLPARLFRRRLQKMLEEALGPGLRALKAEAERRAGS